MNTVVNTTVSDTTVGENVGEQTIEGADGGDPEQRDDSAQNEVVLILYTTRYREGGAEMDAAARLLARQKHAQFPKAEIRLSRVESKAEFLQAITIATETNTLGNAEPKPIVRTEMGRTDAESRNISQSRRLRELHFIGHSGLYGPMFGTRQHPEQMSRYEWGQLEIPFAPGAEAWFHCCRSGRWFAPFFARQYGVASYGYQSYTTFSLDSDRYLPTNKDSLPVVSTAAGDKNNTVSSTISDVTRKDKRALKNVQPALPVYVVSVPGFKGMGVRGLLKKRVFGSATLPMLRFAPQTDSVPDASYNPIAELYDAVFEDFRVRHDEWQWLSRQLEDRRGDVELLDIGCGNGALLLALAPLLRCGIGVDAAKRMIECAQRRGATEPNLSFVEIDGPCLPLPDASVDVVVSMLSWRYLDWDPMTAEIKRVLRPGGQLLIVDMVVAPFQLKTLPRVIIDKVRTAWLGMASSSFRRTLRHLVDDPRWATMLQHNPMRAEHEMRWYLPSRFAGGTFSILNRSPRTEILAFRWDSDGATVRDGVLNRDSND